MRKIWVAAREGIKVPRETSPRRYIESTPVEVELTTYYRRQLGDGDLREVAAPAAPAAKEGAR